MQSQSGGTLPAFGHVFIVVLENDGFSGTTGSSMPYLTSLYSNTAGLTGVYGGLATNYFADTHPSIGNYFTLSTGQILTNDDSQTASSFPVSVDNIALEVQRAGKTWKDYHETSGTYYVRHDPLAYMTNITSSNIVSFSQFATDLANGSLPNLSWIVPNGCDDAHDCSVSTADNWLKTNIGPLLSSALFKKDGLLIVVFDENQNTGNSCGLTTGTGCGGQVEAVVVSPFVTNVSGGATSSNSYEHENTLRTMAQGLGLTTFPGAAASAAPMSDFFTTSGGGGSPLAISTTSLPGGTQGQAYPSTQLGATGGTTPYAWSATGLPTGLSLSSGGLLTGTPSQSGTFTPSFQVTDSSSPKQSASATIDIQIATSGGGGGGGTSVTLTPSSLSFTQAVGGTSATQFATLSNTGSTTVTSVASAITLAGGPFAFAGVGTCNTGQSLSPGGSCTFSIHFTPAAAQTYTGALTVTDSVGTQTVNLNGTGTSSGGGGTPLSVTTTSLPGGTQGQAYPSTQLNATGGTAPYHWSLASGSALPTGLSLSAAGTITGTPTESGTFAPIFQVADSSSSQQTAIATLDITIAASSGGGGGGSGSCTLFVSPSGSDSNSGSSSSSPWQTVQKAFSTASAGQTVCFMAGTYPIASTLQNGYSQILNGSGTASSPIVFTNYPGQVAIIEGNTRVNGAYAKFQGTPMTFPYGLVFQGPTGQALDLIDVMNTHDVTFDHVEIRDDDYHAGIYQYGGYNIKILGCYIHDNGRFADGTTYINNDHGIYWDATTGGGNLVANNLIEHNLAMGMQLYSSGSSTTPSDVTVEENTFVNNGNYGMVVWGQSNTVVNNIFSNNGAMANNPQFNIYASTNHVIDSNIFWSSNTSQQGFANQTGQSVTHAITVNPLFVAPSSNNYQLQSTSPAINVGNTGYQQATDILGAARSVPDLGAYEFASGGGGGGGGGGSLVTLLPASLSFTQAVGSGASADQLVTLTNTGSTTVTGISSALTPTSGPFAFAGVGSCSTGQSLAPGASCTFSLNFTPAAAQSYAGTLTVTDSAGTQSASLNGTGTSAGGGGGGTGSCNLYVSPSGSDSNAGTSSSSAWKTVQHAFSSAVAGQTVCFMAGAYPLTTTSGYSQIQNNSGTSSSPITFTNVPGAVAVLHGNTRINGSYIKFVGTPQNTLAAGLVFSGEGGTGQALDLIDVMNTHDVTFDHVEIRNADYHAGIYLYNVSNVKLLGDYIHDNGRFNQTVTAQGDNSYSVDQGIYVDSTSGGGNLIANCVIYHNRAMGIQLYPSPSGVVVEENTIADNDNYGMVIYGSSNVIVNNIFSNNGWYTNNPQFNVYKGTNHVIDSNVLWSLSPSRQGYTEKPRQKVTNSVIKDPLLSLVPLPPTTATELPIASWDLSTLNFQVLAGSPASGVGNPSYTQPVDKNMVSRTTPVLGAYEQ